MARESSDPDQVSYFSEPGEDAPLPPAVDIVVGGPKTPPEPKTPPPPAPETRQAENARRAAEIASPPPRAPPDPPRAGPVTPDPREDPSIELRRQLDLQRGATERAERAAREAMARANAADARVGQANVHMVGSAIEAATRASDQARSQMEACLNAGDHRGAADAQIALADARANLLRLAEQKAILEEDARRPPQPPQAPQQPQPQAFDAAAAMQNIVNELTRTGLPRSAQWVRAHPEWVSSREAINRVDGAHGYAINNLGLKADSDAYFDKMEELLGMRQPPQSNYRQPESRPANPNARASAPVNPGAPSYRSGESRQLSVHLTPEMREHAHNVLGMTDEEYAAELARAFEEGKLLSTRLS
jgi:hypothetical protein